MKDTKPSTVKSKGKSGPNVLQVVGDKSKTLERTMAEVGLSPCGASASTAKAFANDFVGELHITDAIGVLSDKAKRVQQGDLSEVEATLTAQAAALDTIFNGLAKRAASNMGTHLNATETYLRLALKAQSQCRATLETLAEIKYPKAATFVRQQNVAYQQQVNNDALGNIDTGSHVAARTRNLDSQQNRLLDGEIYERT